ncbi:MAG: flagellar filament capping protein FliD [Lachnospiraceae bacterium]|nr:flagellar filament capping protein FliD [Lachnospiraceae bacterium]
MIRITGMNSGLDTDRIIHELVRGQRTKVDTIKQNQTSIQWKQDAWKDLNNRALKLFNGTLGKMRFSDAYAKKISRVSNNKASVVTGGNAVNGVQNLQISNLAKTGILTGAQIKKQDGTAVDSNTRLSEIMDVGSGDMSFTVKVNGRERQINLNGDTRVQDVVQQFRNAGLNANFDAGNGRFFISSQTMGAAGDFSIVADNQNGFSALSALGINVFDASDYEGLASVQKFEADGTTFTAAYKELLDAEVARILAADQTALNSANNSLTSLRNNMKGRIDGFKEWLKENDPGFDLTDISDANVMARMGILTGGLKSDRDTKQAELNALNNDIENETNEDAKALLLEKKKEVEGELADLNKQVEATGYDKYNTEAFEADIAREIDLAQAVTDAQAVVDDTAGRQTKAAANVDADIAFANHALTLTGNQIGLNGASRVHGQDAEILLNGAKFTSSTNVFNINGLTITANQVTEPGESITITTEDDTQGIYDMIKDFLKEYNALINEMDRLFNAPSARDFRPLTDEEKDAMSDREIEDWEKRIKDSLLRRDSSLFNISNAMKNAMMGGVQVGGQTKHLSNFGIGSLDFFLAAINEKNALFIDGDPDSGHTSGKPDKLKEAIANDPKGVTDFFTGLARNLHGAMDKILLERNDSFKSINTIYNDKQLKRDFDSLTSAIARQEERLKQMEDKFYKQFSRMEVALAKMQSSQSAISGLLGMTMGNR